MAPRRVAIACLLIAAVIGWLGAEVVSYSRNTLLNHPDWASGKTLLSHRLMGADFGVRTRNLLQRNRANLREWFSSNELLLDRVFALGRLELSFRLDEGGYLALEFNRTAESFSAVRLSRSASRPSAYLRAEADGAFLERLPLEGLDIDGGWHRAVIRAAGDSVSLEIDGRAVSRFAVEPLAEQVVGFRSGQARTLVDDVLVADVAGEVLIDESFRNDAGIWRLRAIFFLGALLVLAVVVAIARRRRTDETRLLFRLVLGAYLAVLALASYYCVDYFIWSSRYPYKAHTPWRPGHRLDALERARRSAFSPFAVFDARDERGVALTWEGIGEAYPRLRRFLRTAEELPSYRVQVLRAGTIGKTLDLLPFDAEGVERYLAEKPAGDAYSILLLGTSQTEGTGASHPESSIAGHLGARLSQLTARPVTVFNAAIRGTRSTELAVRLRKDLAPLEPDLVVVNLSHNDYLDGFADGLRSIVGTSRERGARVLFVLEAFNLEHDPTHLLQKHAIMRDVGRELEVPVVDLYGAIAERQREDAGFIWWDLVHLTSFGQVLAGESIAAGILEHFADLRPTPPDAGWVALSSSRGVAAARETNGGHGPEPYPPRKPSSR